VPLLRQPGEAWLYNTCSDIQGVLVARAAGQPFPDFLAERIYEPLGMEDTGFYVPPEKLDRLPPYHGLEGVPRIDDRLWTEPNVFPSGAGGLVSTLADWHRFGRMLIADGAGILSPESTRLLMGDRLTEEQREASTLFLEGDGWGFGGSVAPDGRYGWVGGTGTSAHVVPSSRTVGILFTQVQMAGPTPVPLMREFWAYAFGVR
jgi:CubicO group peptidase (beta-lactamase class C family)